MFFVCFSGAKRYNDNMKAMLGFDIGNYMKVCWTIITPIITLVRNYKALHAFKIIIIIHTKAYRYLHIVQFGISRVCQVDMHSW